MPETTGVGRTVPSVSTSFTEPCCSADEHARVARLQASATGCTNPETKGARASGSRPDPARPRGVPGTVHDEGERRSRDEDAQERHQSPATSLQCPQNHPPQSVTLLVPDVVDPRTGEARPANVWPGQGASSSMSSARNFESATDNSGSTAVGSSPSSDGDLRFRRCRRPAIAGRRRRSRATSRARSRGHDSRTYRTTADLLRASAAVTYSRGAGW